MKVVCVTGASGYIASWLVKLLLQRGYTVKATVRDPSDTKKTGHLLALDGAKERLHLYKADLLEEGSFESVVDGCDGVFHAASPVLLTPKDPKMELIDPAVKGTINVLSSCAKVPTITKVVITSSIVSVAFNGKSLTSDVTVDETWFSDPVFCEKSKLWYPVSKTLAEEAAWRFAREKGIDLVTMHPGFVIGPLLQASLNLSAEMFLNLINGDLLVKLFPSDAELFAAATQTLPDTSYRFVDVRDVAHAHIQAIESPSANGRYCLVHKVLHSHDALKILRELYPALHLPEKFEDEKPSVPTYKISNERARSLGVSFIPLEVSFKDTVESLKEKGFFKD